MTRARDLKPVCRTVGRWLTGQEALGKYVLSAFTGQDVAALHALLALARTGKRGAELLAAADALQKAWTVVFRLMEAR